MPSLSSKFSFLNYHVTTQHSDFCHFFAILQTSKLVVVVVVVDDYALGVAALFRVKRVYLSRYSQKTKEGVRAIDLFSLYVLVFPVRVM